MSERKLLYEGKAKKVFEAEEPETLVVSYKDDATAFNGLKKRNHHRKGRNKQQDEQSADADA